jgi:hypothetical protein
MLDFSFYPITSALSSICRINYAGIWLIIMAHTWGLTRIFSPQIIEREEKCSVWDYHEPFLRLLLPQSSAKISHLHIENEIRLHIHSLKYLSKWLLQLNATWITMKQASKLCLIEISSRICWLMKDMPIYRI